MEILQIVLIITAVALVFLFLGFVLNSDDAEVGYDPNAAENLDYSNVKLGWPYGEKKNV